MHFDGDDGDGVWILSEWKFVLLACDRWRWDWFDVEIVGRRESAVI